MPTPYWAKENNCGQYNGYIAFGLEAESAFNKPVEQDGIWYDEYQLPWTVKLENGEVEAVECSMSMHATLEKMGPMIPITEIPKEAADGGKFVVFGFDTCHTWNTWEKYDYIRVRSMTLAWFEEARKMLPKEFTAQDAISLLTSYDIFDLRDTVRRVKRILDSREMVARALREDSEEPDED